MSEPKKEITLMQAAPWIAVVVLGYLFWSKQDATPGPRSNGMKLARIIWISIAAMFVSRRDIADALCPRFGGWRIRR